jgi:hypothetical protein
MMLGPEANLPPPVAVPGAVLADFCWHRLRACEFMLPLEELEALDDVAVA